MKYFLDDLSFNCETFSFLCVDYQIKTKSSSKIDIKSEQEDFRKDLHAFTYLFASYIDSIHSSGT